MSGNTMLWYIHYEAYLAEFIFKKHNRRVYSYNLYFEEILDLNFNLHKKNERSMNFKT